MQNLKIKVNNKAESKEVQELLFELGYEWYAHGKTISYLDAIATGDFGYLVAWKTGCFSKHIIQMGCGKEDAKETTIAELRSMVKPMKEYLIPDNSGYRVAVQCASLPIAEDWIEIPDGAEHLTKCNDHNDDEWLLFWKGNCKFCVGHDKEWFNFESGVNEYLDDWDGMAKIIWQRPTQPEALPFIDDEPQSLNEQYAEIEQVRQSLKDNVNHPNHYTQGKVECIDALESATIGKSGIEAVCVANIIKYLWRYEEKNGLEDIKKANFYLNRLITTLENNNG